MVNTISEELGSRLKEYLNKKYIDTEKEGKKTYVMHARQCGKTQEITDSVISVLAILDSIGHTVKKLTGMRVEDIPLHINDEDYIMRDASTWILKEISL